jgi:hypothetical protein
VIGDYFDLKNQTLEYGFFLPIRSWKPLTATVIGVYLGAGPTNGYITKIPRCTAPPGAR